MVPARKKAAGKWVGDTYTSFSPDCDPPPQTEPGHPPFSLSLGPSVLSSLRVEGLLPVFSLRASPPSLYLHRDGSEVKKEGAPWEGAEEGRWFQGCL